MKVLIVFSLLRQGMFSLEKDLSAEEAKVKDEEKRKDSDKQFSAIAEGLIEVPNFEEAVAEKKTTND